jgi:FAD/FMN-containing dehydrogenase/Fe-S oxidoreductase
MTVANGKDTAGAIRALGVRVGCEVRTDRLSRVLYSTDASNHQVEPLAVAFPRDIAELAEVITAAADLGLPVLPRGAGTSLAGQAVGRGVVLDLSRHMATITSLEPEADFIEAEAGAVLAAVNTYAARRGLMYGPDPASADRATVGGVVGNNASGAHSIRYGMTADHLEAIEAVLSDGSVVTLGGVTEVEAQRRASGNSLEGSLYRSALDIRSRYASHVQERWPRTWRRASGYSLNYLTGFHPTRPPSWYADPEPYPPDRGLNLATLLCGSEGTLAAVGRARLRLVPRPQATILAILPFADLVGACDAAAELLEHRPDVVELVPRSILQRAGTVAGFSRKLSFAPPGAEALLLVEFAGATMAEAAALGTRLAKHGPLITEREAQDEVWAVRKAGLGLLMSLPGDLKPIEFVEDAAVPVERLGEYVRRVNRLLASAGTRGEWYAHASAGCLHLRPLLNLKDARDHERMRQIAESVLDIVIEMGGSLSGEHGDGLSRTRYNERLFGPAVLQGFRDIKQAWDPLGIMNPGKVVPLEGALSGPDQDLRPPILSEATRRRTWFAFRRELDWAHAAEGCNGQGECLKRSGVMCPSFQALHEEAHSTRGRANALRAVFSGVFPSGALTSDELHAVLDLCLECKACKSECPSSVDMARMKAEFLAAYQAERGVPLRARAFAEIHTLAEWAQHLHPLANALAPWCATRWVQEGLFGIAKRRKLPRFAGQRFSQWLARHAAPVEGAPVVLFLDTYTETMCPEVGQAAVKVLEASGCRVLLAEGQGCCGRPMISKGLLGRARQMAGRNLRALAPHAAAGTAIVGLEPSCLLTLRDEYLEFFPDDKRARQVADASMLIEEFLVRRDANGARPLDQVRHWAPNPGVCALHGHCYTKALVGTQPTREMLEASGWSAKEIDAGCCGMAGAFGYEAEHVELSMQIAEQRLLPAVRSADAEGHTVCAPGFSCRGQILDGTGVRALHPIQAVAAMLPDTTATERSAESQFTS